MLLGFILAGFVLHAQTNYAVLVTDASNGDRVVNALVKHKETNIFDGITNESGSMVIQASPGDVLRVMRDGYTSQEVTLSANKAVSIMLGLKKEKPVLKAGLQSAIFKGNKIRGTIYRLDEETGNIWTNITLPLFRKLNIKVGDSIHCKIFSGKKQVYSYNVPFLQVFANVEKEKPLAFINAFLQLAFAINQGNFSETNKIYSGKEWTVEISAKR
jgi:hypothetical protein